MVSSLAKSPLPPAVTGRVARVILEGVLDHDVLRAKLHARTRPMVIETYDLVPGPEGPLRIGYDDLLILKFAHENIFQLEDEIDREERFYSVSVETAIIPLSLGDKPIPKIEFRPLNMIIANSMEQAIKTFESEGGLRLWLPLNGLDNQFDTQIGISRVSGNIRRNARKVMIHRIRKDCVMKGSEN